MSDYTRALLILIVSGATIGGALAFQLFGYPPCELCLMQRWPYYAGIPLAIAVTFAAATDAPPRVLLVAGFWLLAIVFAGSAVFGAYHAGVEWGFWPGPSSCTGKPAAPGSMEEFHQQLSTVRVVRCDAVAIRILGLSLAGWNAVISLALAIVAAGGGTARRIAR